MGLETGITESGSGSQEYSGRKPGSVEELERQSSRLQGSGLSMGLEGSLI